MKGTFNQGWWNCFETFAAELLSTQNAEDICISVLTGAASSFLLCKEDGEHPHYGANPIFAKASDIYRKRRSNDTSQTKNLMVNGFALRFHLRVKTPQYSRLLLS